MFTASECLIFFELSARRIGTLLRAVSIQVPHSSRPWPRTRNTDRCYHGPQSIERSPGSVPVHGNETPNWSLRGECRWVKLILPDLSRRPVAVALDDPGAVIAILEVDQRQAEVLDGLEAA